MNNVEADNLIKTLAEENGVGPATLKEDLEIEMYIQIVSTLRVLATLSSEPQGGAEYLLRQLRGAEETDRESLVGKVANVILDAYFYHFGNWVKMEQYFLECLTEHGVSAEKALAAEPLIQSVAAKKMALSRKGIAKERACGR